MADNDEKKDFVFMSFSVIITSENVVTSIENVA